MPDTVTPPTTPPATPPVLHARAVEIRDRHRTLLPQTTLNVRRGEVAVVVGDPGPAHTALALALAGRMDCDHGVVDLDDDVLVETLQRRVALVDVAGVSAPDDVVPVPTIVGEELAMARQPARASHVRSWLEAESLSHVADLSIEELAPADRVRMLARLAALRPADFLVLALPDRHGGLPQDWLATLTDLAGEGRGVLLTLAPAHAARLPHGLATYEIGNGRDLS